MKARRVMITLECTTNAALKHLKNKRRMFLDVNDGHGAYYDVIIHQAQANVVKKGDES